MSATSLALLDRSQPDFSEAMRFLDFLARGNPKEKFTFATIPEGPQDFFTVPSNKMHGCFVDHSNSLKNLNEQNRSGIFLTLNRTDGRGRKKENVHSTRAIAFLDLDGPPLDLVLESQFKSHAVIETSPGRYHVYFALTDLPLKLFTEVQQALADRFNGDPVVNDVTRLVRVPGFLHHKRSEPYLSRIVHILDDSPHELGAFLSWLEVRTDTRSPTQISRGSHVSESQTSIPEGSRNITLTRFAGAMRKHRASADTMTAALIIHNQDVCTPPLDEREIQRIAASVARYPVSANDQRWPQLPDAALYGIAGEIAHTVAQLSEADPAAVLISALVRAGATFGSSRYVAVGDTHHPPRLFACKVGSSSKARKGTSEDPVDRIFKAADEARVDRQVIVNDELNPSFVSIDPLKVSPGPMSSGEGLIYPVRDPSDELYKDGELIDPGVPDKRLLIIESEFAAPLKAAQRHGNTLSPLIRSAWDHGNIAPLTKNLRLSTTGAHICIIGHITEEELRELLPTSDIWNGFANRFLWLCVRRQRLVARPKALPDDIVAGYADRLAEVLSAPTPGAIEFHTEAGPIWDELYPELSQERSGRHGCVTSRSESQTLRLALIFALLDGSDVIRESHLRAAIAVWQFCDESARYLFGPRGSDPIESRILDALATGPKSQGDLYKILGGHVKSDRLNDLLGRLEAEGIVQHSEQRTPGRPAKIWRLKQSL